MSYCERYGEFPAPDHSPNETCETIPSSYKNNTPRTGYGYDIHCSDCRHGLKLEPMTLEEKLSLLGNKKPLFLVNLGLILTVALLLIANIFRSDNPLLKDIVNAHGGLFGPNGSLLTALYFMGLLVAVIIAASPAYSRITYNPVQFLPAMVMEGLIPLIVCITVWQDFYFGDYVGTTLTLWGGILLLISIGALVVQLCLVFTYNQVKKSGVYVYVAN